MSNVVIVAIPSKWDNVWKVSSEKVPHLTICFLGDQLAEGEVSKIEDFLGHATKYVTPFDLSVEERGKLGDDEADVLFFNGYQLPEVREYRRSLLNFEPIRKAYDANDKYDGVWTPHLTLGYPDAPARDKEIDRFGMEWVHFDRIALWTGDYDGPEFVLKFNNIPTEAIAMGANGSEIAENVLAHYGVKGMKWGVRKSEPHTKDVTIKAEHDKKGKVVLKTTGGAGHDPHMDAVRAANLKQIHRLSGMSALSNAQLQELATRQDLEAKVSRLNPADKSRGKKVADEILKTNKGLKEWLDVIDTVDRVQRVAKTKDAKDAKKKHPVENA